MSKNTTTVSVSLPTVTAIQLDSLCKELNINRSAVTTALLSLTLNWISDKSAKEILNSLYGRG